MQLTGTTRPPRVAAAMIDSALAFTALYLSANTLSNFLSKQTLGDHKIAIGLSLYAAYLMYFFVFEWLLQATPGKLLTGLCIRQLDGGPCTARIAAVRTLARIIEVNPLILGAIPAALLIYFSSRRQRFGDMLAGSVVVERRPTR